MVHLQLLNSLVLFFVLISFSKCLQFGYYVSDSKGRLVNRFAIIGILPDSVSSTIQTEVLDQLNLEIHEESLNRKFEGIDRTSFNVCEITTKSLAAYDQTLLFLKGELSVFSTLFKYSRGKIIHIKNYWTTAKFLSYPVIILDSNESNNFNGSFELTIVKAGITKTQDAVYENFILKEEISQNSDIKDSLLLLDSEDLIDSTSCNSCCRCYIC